MHSKITCVISVNQVFGKSEHKNVNCFYLFTIIIIITISYYLINKYVGWALTEALMVARIGKTVLPYSNHIVILVDNIQFPVQRARI